MPFGKQALAAALVTMVMAGPATGGADAKVLSTRTVTVGGAAMDPRRNIIENTARSSDHTTLVVALNAAGLIDMLSGPGPFTVFAPTNQAFAQLPPGTVESLVKPVNKDTLARILTYHVVSGRLDSKAIALAIRNGKGRAVLKTVQGDALTATTAGTGFRLTDAKGNAARVTTADVYQSNGVIHVVDTVLMPQ